MCPLFSRPGIASSGWKPGPSGWLRQWSWCCQRVCHCLHGLFSSARILDDIDHGIRILISHASRSGGRATSTTCATQHDTMDAGQFFLVLYCNTQQCKFVRCRSRDSNTDSWAQTRTARSKHVDTHCPPACGYDICGCEPPNPFLHC
jgi:hypothetical protein